MARLQLTVSVFWRSGLVPPLHIGLAGPRMIGGRMPRALKVADCLRLDSSERGPSPLPRRARFGRPRLVAAILRTDSGFLGRPARAADNLARHSALRGDCL